VGNIERKIAYAQKIARAAEMRDQGYPWDEVARAFGWSNADSAGRAVRSYFAKHPSLDVEAVREEEERQLQTLRREAWKSYKTVQFAVSSRGLVTDDEGLPVVDYSHKDRALNTLLRISESRRRLHGADRPVRVAIETETGALGANAQLQLQLQLQSGVAGAAGITWTSVGSPVTVSLSPTALTSPGAPVAFIRVVCGTSIGGTPLPAANAPSSSPARRPP
jgi:hypothetical protein